MANPEHLAILKQGVAAWNKWREENPDVTPNLMGATLKGAKFEGVNLMGATLEGANLAYADLKAADLREANLGAANLMGANLKDAHLFAALLLGTNLKDTNLEDAILIAANLEHAVLTGADLVGAQLLGTAIGGVDLSQTRRLDTVYHMRPSSIGTDTLELTAQGLSKNPPNRGAVETFLRGAGVAEHMIDYFRSMIGKPIEFYSCFISYNHEDKAFARRLHDQLQARGIRCWLDEHQVLPGDHILDEVDRGIRLWDKVLLCCSRESLASIWVDREIEKALKKEERLWKERGKRVLAIIPLDLDGHLFEWQSSKADLLQARLAADFTDWEHDNAKFEEQFERVVKALRTEREKPPEARL